MTSAQFNVVVEGQLLPGFDRDTVLAQLQQQLKLSAAKAGQLLAGNAIVVKRDVTAAVAAAYCARLRSLGVDAHPVETTATAVSLPYFDDLPTPLPDIHNSGLFQRALYRGTARLLGIIAAYSMLCLLAFFIALFYLIHFAHLLIAPPVLFSATLYLLPAGALVVLCALLLRPFLPAPASTIAAMAVTRAGQPALFAFVEQLCARLALKAPHEIALSAQTHSSVEPLPGVKNFWSGNYRLTLSLPLLEASRIPLYAGMLAADLRTGASAAGMRYGGVLRLIRQRTRQCAAGADWLRRQTDALLARIERFALPLQITRFLFDRSNRLLGGFAARAEAVDTRLARARLRERDRYLALFAGSAALADALMTEEKLKTAAAEAIAKNTEDRLDGGFVDNLPALIRHYYESFDEKFERELRRRWDNETIPRRDAAPIARERLEQLAAAPARMNADAAAITLLKEAHACARTLTLLAYRAAGYAFSSDALLSTETVAYAATQDIQQRQQAAVYFNDWFAPFRFWKLAEYKLIRDMPLQDAAEQLGVCVNEIRRLSPDRHKLLAEYERVQNQLFELLIGQHVLAAGKKYPFRYINHDGTTLQPLIEDRQQQLTAISEKLALQETVMGGRITLGLRLSGQSEYDVTNLHDAMRMIHDSGARLHKLQLDVYQLEQLLPRHHRQHEADYSAPIKRLEEKIRDASTLLLVRLADIPCPLDTRHRSLKSYVEAALEQSDRDEAKSPVQRRARRLLDVLFMVNEKLSLLAAEYGTIAEEAYKIEPIKLVATNA